MKRFFAGLVILLAMAVIFTISTSSITKKAKGFRGTVTYSLSYEGDGLTPAQLAMMPTSIKTKMFDDMSSTEMVMGAIAQTYISNPAKDKLIILIEGMGKKLAIEKKYSEIKSIADSAKTFTVQYELKDETKVIAGYTCKKAVVTQTPKEGTEGEEIIYSIYYCPELGNAESNKDSDLAGIPGLLMEFKEIKDGITTTYTVSEIKKGGVSELDFLLPEGFKVVTEEQIQEEFMGE